MLIAQTLASEDHVSVSLGQHGSKYKAIELRDRNRYRCLTFVQKLSQAKNLQDVVEIQTEFVQMQIETFNKRAKELGAAVAATEGTF